jgi:5-(hydroxymethyl)furfural/furfural oxidase
MNKSSWHGLGESVCGLGVCLLGPRSRGRLRLTSADPAAPPDIDFGMLTDADDHRKVVDGLQTAVELMCHEAVAPLRHELFATGYGKIVRRLNEPGLGNVVITRALAALLDGPDRLRHAMLRWGIAGGDVDEARMQTRAWAERTVLRRTFGTYHPACTCRLGHVVDPRCSVLGTEGLSVVDASVMPTLVRANTNIPVTMIAERAADLLLA